MLQAAARRWFETGWKQRQLAAIVARVVAAEVAEAKAASADWYLSGRAAGYRPPIPVLQREHQLLVWPAGGGKSLIFQGLSLVPNAATLILVITPLLALAQEQCEGKPEQPCRKGTE